MRPGSRIVPIHFQTVAKTNGRKKLEQLDAILRGIFGPKMTGGKVIALKDAVQVLELTFANLEFDEEALHDAKPFLALLEHLSRTTKEPENRNLVYLLAATDRNVVRVRPSGRFSDAPDTKQQAEEARDNAKGIPALMMLRQNGKEDDQWRGLPFWWPVLVVPSDAVTCVFAGQSADGDAVDAAAAVAVTAT